MSRKKALFIFIRITVMFGEFFISQLGAEIRRSFSDRYIVMSKKDLLGRIGPMWKHFEFRRLIIDKFIGKRDGIII